MSKKFQFIWAKYKEVLLSYLIMSIVVVLYISTQKNFFTAYGIKSTFDQFLTLLFAGLAQTVVILTGGIDLSVGSIIGLSNTIMAFAMVPIAQAVGSDLGGVVIVALITLAIGLAAGLVNGFIIVYGRLQPIIVTLSTSYIFTGIGMLILSKPDGQVVSGFSKMLIGTTSALHLPKSCIWMLIAIFAIWMPIRKSKFGQSVYAIGGNEYSAFVSGINLKKTKIMVYMLSGLFSSVAGILLTAQTSIGDPTGSGNFTMNSIAAVVLGGTALSGGRGSYVGTVAGVITYSLILGLLIFSGISSFYQDMIKGMLLVLALAFNVIQRIQLKKKAAVN